MQDEISKINEFPYTLGILADRTGIAKSTLREWVERHQLIRPIGHSPGRKPYRLFDNRSARIALVIKNLRDQGFGISLIKKRLAEETLQRLEDEVKNRRLGSEKPD